MMRRERERTATGLHEARPAIPALGARLFALQSIHSPDMQLMLPCARPSLASRWLAVWPVCLLARSRSAAPIRPYLVGQRRVRIGVGQARLELAPPTSSSVSTSSPSPGPAPRSRRLSGPGGHAAAAAAAVVAGGGGARSGGHPRGVTGSAAPQSASVPCYAQIYTDH